MAVTILGFPDESFVNCRRISDIFIVPSAVFKDRNELRLLCSTHVVDSVKRRDKDAGSTQIVALAHGKEQSVLVSSTDTQVYMNLP